MYKSLYILIALLFPYFSYCHSGGTDSKGGHYNRSTGSYHYHHGNGPHKHVDGWCTLKGPPSEKKNNTLIWVLGVAGTLVLGRVYLINEFEIKHAVSQIKNRIRWKVFKIWLLKPFQVKVTRKSFFEGFVDVSILLLTPLIAAGFVIYFPFALTWSIIQYIYRSIKES